MKKKIITIKNIVNYFMLALFLSAGSWLIAEPNTHKHSDSDKHADSVKGKLKINQAAPVFTLSSADNKKHSLADYKGKYVVLEWVNYQCPFVKKHYKSGNMQRLQKKYTAKDVVWLTICSSAEGKQGYYEGKALTRAIKKAKASSRTYLIDTSGVVGRAYQAKVTPHMVVINPEGNVVYTGAIDSIASANKKDIKKAENYVDSVFSALYAKKSVSKSKTSAYGCNVKYAN